MSAKLNFQKCGHFLSQTKFEKRHAFPLLFNTFSKAFEIVKMNNHKIYFRFTCLAPPPAGSPPIRPPNKIRKKEGVSFAFQYYSKVLETIKMNNHKIYFRFTSQAPPPAGPPSSFRQTKFERRRRFPLLFNSNRKHLK